MVTGFIKTLAATAAFLGAAIALQPTMFANASETAVYASLGGETSVPFGWVDFCRRYEGECRASGAARDVNLTAQAMREIDKINRWVNANVEAITDQEHWGLADRWDLPLDGKGDCEDYALLKRKLLIGMGFPAEALLMTVVKDSQNEGHAILTVKTNKGEFALDNLDDAVRPWTQTGYRYVKRQSQENPNVWVSIGAPVVARNGASL